MVPVAESPVDPGRRGAGHRARPRRPGPAGGAPVGAGGEGLLGDGVRRGRGLGRPPGGRAGRGGHGRPHRRGGRRGSRAGAADGPDLSRPGLRIVVAPLERGVVVPAAKVAILAEADFTGRRRAHRPPGPGPGPPTGSSTTSPRATTSCTASTGWPATPGMVTRTVNGASRDYLLLEYRGDDKLYLPSDQIDALTPYSGGESPTLNRLGGSEWQRTRAKARAAVHEVAQELVELYRLRLHMEGHAFAPDTPWQRELEDSFAFTETVDQLRAVEEVKSDMESAVPDGPAGVRRRRVRQDRGGGAGRVQGRPGRQAGRRARPHHAAGPAARPDLRRALRRIPGASRDAVALSHPGPGP